MEASALPVALSEGDEGPWEVVGHGRGKEAKGGGHGVGAPKGVDRAQADSAVSPAEAAHGKAGLGAEGMVPVTALAAPVQHKVVGVQGLGFRV